MQMSRRHKEALPYHKAIFVVKIRDRSGLVCRFLRATEGVSALEYAMVVGIIAIAVGSAVAIFGGNIETVIRNVGEEVGRIETADIELDGEG